MKKIFGIKLALVLMIIITSMVGCNGITDKEKELELKEKELELKEKELELKEKEYELDNKEKTPNNSETKESQKPKKMNLDSKLQREVNIFLSNFTEVYLDDFFDNNPISNISLVDFAVMHNEINNPKTVRKDGYRGYINKSYIERSVKKFFGLSLKHESTEYNLYDGKEYSFYLNNVNLNYLPFAVVFEMTDNLNGTYTVLFEEVYGKSNYNYELSQSKLREIQNKDSEVYTQNIKKAVIGTHVFEGKTTYKLLEYDTVQ